MKNEIIVLAGLSGVGKDTIAQILHDRYDYNFVVSATTRDMRPGEMEGFPYNFVSEEEFNNIPMIEKRSYKTLFNGVDKTYYYGVPKNAIKDNEKYVVVLDVDGTVDFIKNFGNRVIPIMLFIDDDTRKSRSIERGGHDEQEWHRRNLADIEKFTGESAHKIFGYWFKVTDPEYIIHKIKSIVAL